MCTYVYYSPLVSCARSLSLGDPTSALPPSSEILPFPPRCVLLISEAAPFFLRAADEDIPAGHPRGPGGGCAGRAALAPPSFERGSIGAVRSAELAASCPSALS